MPRLSLVVPCYRPQEGWPDRLITRLNTVVGALGDCEVALTLVSDGTDGGLNRDDIDEIHRRLPSLQYLDYGTNRGKGYALRYGLTQAPEADVYAYTDVDLPYTTESMVAVTMSVLRHGGVAAGERFEDYYAGVPPFRRALSRVHRFAMRKMFRLPVSDSQAGLKAFDERGRRVFLSTTIDRFLVDLDFIARCRGEVEVRAVRVRLRPDVSFTNFGLGILRTEARNFIQIFRTSWSTR